MEQPRWVTRESARLEREAEEEERDRNAQWELIVQEKLAKWRPVVALSLPKGVTMKADWWRLPKEHTSDDDAHICIGFELTIAPELEVALREKPNPGMRPKYKQLALYYGGRHVTKVEAAQGFESLTGLVLIPALLKAYQRLTHPPTPRKQE